MRARMGILGGLGAVALAFLAGRVSAQAPAQAPPQQQAIPIPPPAGAMPKVAASVNGEPISGAEVLAVLSQQPPSSTPLTAMQRRQMERSAVEMLIEDALMHQFLRKNAPAAPAAEIDKELNELREALKKDKTPQTLEEFLKETGQTEAQLRADIAARVQWKLYVAPKLNDATVKAYYDTNKVFFDKVFVRASHVLLRLAPNATPADRQAATQKLQAIRQEILAGKLDFADAAKKYSDCPSKQSGGDIGPFPYKFAVLPPFARAAFAMKVGEVSEIVETDFGLHLIKVTNRDNGQPSDLSKIQDSVKQVYSQEMYQGIIAEQRRTARIEIFFPADK